MDIPIPTINPTEFSSYANYLAARVDEMRATRIMGRTETIGRFARTEEDGDGGEESVVIGKTGNFANLSAGSLRELQTGLWKADI